jgi:hypothetical protein
MSKHQILNLTTMNQTRYKKIQPTSKSHQTEQTKSEIIVLAPAQIVGCPTLSPASGEGWDSTPLRSAAVVAETADLTSKYFGSSDTPKAVVSLEKVALDNRVRNVASASILPSMQSVQLGQSAVFPMTKQGSSVDFPTLPARSLEDISIPEDAMRLDNELAKRTDDSAMDLAKWALLGIAGYGFLLKEMALPNGAALLTCQRFAWVLITGPILLAAAAASALWGKERLIKCSVYQMYILRSLKKLGNGGWSEEQTAILKKDLANYRTEQKKNISLASGCLKYAHVLLAGGAIMTVICFALVLFSMKK